MRERQQRLKTIKKIIRDNKVESQEALLALLEREGYQVTQATLSRDLKLLKVGKQAEGTKGYYYALPSEEIRRERERNFVDDFLRGYVSIDFTTAMAVIKTLTGHADSVAISLDNMNIDEVLGTVAGDDTVMVAMRDTCTPESFLATLRERIPGFED